MDQKYFMGSKNLYDPHSFQTQIFFGPKTWVYVGWRKKLGFSLIQRQLNLRLSLAIQTCLFPVPVQDASRQYILQLRRSTTGIWFKLLILPCCDVMEEDGKYGGEESGLYNCVIDGCGLTVLVLYAMCKSVKNILSIFVLEGILDFI